MIYEYTCEKCNHNWEVEQSIKDKPKRRCPNCKKYAAKRLISRGGAFILKGGSWASTGYK